MRLGAVRGSFAQALPLATKLGAELIAVDSAAALLAGDVDAMVRDVADFPTQPTAGLVVAAVPLRSDPRDALCGPAGVTLDSLAPGARVGVGIPLRRALLLARRPDLEPVDIDDAEQVLDRIGGDLDAVVLAAAALEAWGRVDAVAEFLGIDGWPTAPAQGALAVEVRVGTERTVAKLDHRPSRLAVFAERGLLTRLHGHAAPIGAHALLDDGLLFLSATASSLDGSTRLTSSHALYPEDSADPAGDLAQRVADELLAAGLADLVPHGGTA